MAERRFYQGATFANYDPGELLENAEFEDCVFDHCRWLGTRVQNCRFNAMERNALFSSQASFMVVKE